jgi:hypothetical protein
MVIYLGWPSPTTSSSLPAASLAREDSGLAVWVTPRRLFGLAPAGGYPAIAVASDAVGSYPTVSPLPEIRRTGTRAVCFLWPFPSSCDAQALPGSLPLWSSDFPRAPCGARDHRAQPVAGI